MAEADLLTCDNNLACTLQDLGLLEEAVLLHRRVFVNSRKVKGKRHPAALALRAKGLKRELSARARLQALLVAGGHHPYLNY